MTIIFIFISEQILKYTNHLREQDNTFIFCSMNRNWSKTESQKAPRKNYISDNISKT